MTGDKKYRRGLGDGTTKTTTDALYDTQSS